MIRFFSSLIILLASLAQPMHASHDDFSYEETLEEMSVGERVNLEAFLRSFMLSSEGPAGFVLFGSKPMCFTYLQTSHIEFPEKFSDTTDILCYFSRLRELRTKTKINAGYHIWNKYFGTVSTEKYFFSVDEKTGFVTTLNKGNLKNIITDNLSLFKDILGEQHDQDSILKALIDHNKNNGFDNEVLLGVLFGFGRNNALEVCGPIQFSKATHLYQGRNDDEYRRLIPSHKEATSAKSRTFCPPFFMVLPYFLLVADEQESNELMEKYRHERAYITNLLDEKDFLPIILTELFSS